MQTHTHFVPSVSGIAMVISVCCGTLSRVAHADFTFFSDRDAWQSEATTRGFLLGEEDFDDNPDGRGVPMVKVGDVEVWFGVLFNGVQGGKVVPWSGGTTVSLGAGRDIFAGDGSWVAGPVGGIGFDVDLDSASERFIEVVSPPMRPEGVEGLWFPDPSDFVSSRQQYFGEGFVGVLFDSPREGQSFSFGGVNGSIEGVDNLVVAASVVPEPSALSLIAAAVIILGLLRRIVLA